MDEAIVLGVIFIALLVLVALMVKIALFCRAFSGDTRYICRKMDYADSYEEYRRWRGELRCHYLCLIPFVNEKNVMRLYDLIFRRADRAKMKERKDSLVPLLLPSGIGICLCLVCLCSMTWAWFTESYESPTQKLTSAWYEVSVTDVVCDGAPYQLTKSASYSFEAGRTYTIALHADGSVKECGGYCLIEGDGTKQYTQTIKPGDTIKIKLTPEKNDDYTFTGVWGSIPSTVAEDEIIKAIAEDGSQSAAEETTADSSETTAVDTTTVETTEVETTAPDTTTLDPVITEPESTPQETTPDETDPIPIESSDPISSDTSEAEPVSEEDKEDNSEE